MAYPSPEDIAELEALGAAYERAAQADAAAAAELRVPEHALAFLLECHGGDEAGGEVPAPVEVLEVSETEADGNAKLVVARVRCNDGTERWVSASLAHDPGDYDTPPFDDVVYEYAAGT